MATTSPTRLEIPRRRTTAREAPVELSRVRPDGLHKALDWWPHRSGANLPPAWLLMGNAGVDEWKQSLFYDSSRVDPERDALKIERWHQEVWALRKSDFVHRAGDAEALLHGQADNSTNVWRGGLRHPTPAQ